MFVNSDFSDLLRLFNAGRVRYLVVGGYAVVQYAEPRFTADLDLYGHRLSQCPRRLRGPPGVRCAAVGIDRRRFRGTGLLLPDGSSTHAGGCAHESIPGVEFEPAWRRRVDVDFDGLLVPFISRADLISAKRASARPQDMIDVHALLQSDDE